MVWSDMAICCKGRRRKVEGAGHGGAKNSFGWGVEGVDILGHYILYSAGIHVSLAFFKRKSKRKKNCFEVFDDETGSSHG